MSATKRILSIIGAALSAAIIVVCGIIIFNTTHNIPANPQTFSGEVTIISLTPDSSQSWAKACSIEIRDEKKRKLQVNTRSDICGTHQPGDNLTLDAGQVILGEVR